MENSFIRVKFAFREAVDRQDYTTLKMLLTNTTGTALIRKVIAEELFDGFTPLQHACLVQNKEMTALFIEQGVEIEHRGKYGWTALHAASFACKPGNDVTIVSLLLNSCANIAARDEHGCLPIDLAENRAVRDVLLARMEEKGHSELAEMYRRVKRTEGSPEGNVDMQWVRNGAVKAAKNMEGKEIKTEKLQDTKPFGTKDFGFGCFYTSCEERAQFLSDRPILRRDRELGKRRAVSLNIKSKRDSGISLDNSDCFTYI